MSCNLKEIASIEDLTGIIQWLLPNKILPNVEYEDSSSIKEYGNWLEDCKVAVSPSFDIISIAHKNRIVILKSQYERTRNGKKNYVFSLSWKQVLEHWQMGDEITSLLCLPIASNKQSSVGVPDWTTVVVGFKSGYISFHTEAGLLLLSQLFHENAVVDLSVRTFVEKNLGSSVYADLTEEFLVLYPKCLVSIDGFSLLQTLKVCRNQVAKASAVGEEIPNTTSLGYKKWNLSQQEIVSACVAVGMVHPNMYDHVVFASHQVGGVSHSISGAVPTTSIIMTTGRTPFVSSYSIKDGASVPFIADIAVHYASKLKKALLTAASGWLFGNKEEEANKKERPRIEQPVSIPFRYTLPDMRRLGLTIRLSKSRRLASVTDDFGRVTVLDVHKSYALRMFKGYRDAECGWINISGDVEGKREVPILIIHAPRRNLLEVWLPQRGPRLAAFNTAKNSKLIYTSHTLLGANTQQGSPVRSTHVVLINSQGIIETVSVPFHVPLSGTTSGQARDLHLLKSVKNAIKTKSIESILSLVREMKSSATKSQFLSLICGSKFISVEFLTKIFSELKSGLPETQQSENEEQKKETYEDRLLGQQVNRLSQLMSFYSVLTSFHDKSCLLESKAEADEICDISEVDDVLETLVDEKFKIKSKKVGFEVEEKLSLSEFLQGFDVVSTTLTKDEKLPCPIHFKSSVNDHALGSFIFNWSSTVDRFELFVQSVLECGIDASDLFKFSLRYWLYEDCEFDRRMVLLFLDHWLILSILIDPKFHFFEPSELRPLWITVREELTHCGNPIRASLAAYVFRSVELAFLNLSNEMTKQEGEESSKLEATEAVNLIKKLKPTAINAINRAKSDPDSLASYEELSMEVVEWTLILKNLKKLVAVQKLHLALTRREKSRNLYEQSECSLKMFHQNGKGYLSEMLAHWFIESNLPVASIVLLISENENEDNGETGEEESSKTQNETTQWKNDELRNLRELFVVVRSDFPESTRPDVILVNLSWELALLWKKSPNSVGFYGESVESFKSISNPFLRHGVCCMMWETWVVHFVQKSTYLIDKISRRPKERLSLRNIGLSELSLDSFLSSTKELLETIMAASAACEIARALNLGKDDFWKDIECSPSLADHALAQKMTSCDLTFLHQQLVSVLVLVVRYELRGVRPSVLFPERDRASFFKPLISSWCVTSEEGREVVSNAQLSFLNKVVSASVIGLPDGKNASSVETPQGLFDAIEVGRFWGVSLDAIRRHYICELYSSGLDAVAEQALIMVRDGVMAASQMMVIAGQRLRYLITSSPNSMEVTALITPNMKEWCSTLDPGILRCPNVPAGQTLRMVQKALVLIPESNREHNVAANLVRALKTIHEAGY